MTDTHPSLLACPRCAETLTAPLSDGRRYCTACALEWDPADPPTFDPPAVATSGGPAPAGDDTYGTYASNREPDAVLGDMVGSHVRLVDGRVVQVVGFPDDDHMTVLFDAGDTFDVDFNDVAGSAEPAATAVPAELPDDQQVEMRRTALQIAGYVIEAALDILVDAGDGLAMTDELPATGWAPADADVLPIVEMGAAYAVAFVLQSYELDLSAVARLRDRIKQDTTNTEQEGGNTDDERTRDSESGGDAGDDDRTGEADLHGMGDGADQGQ